MVHTTLVLFPFSLRCYYLYFNIKLTYTKQKKPYKISTFLAIIYVWLIVSDSSIPEILKRTNIQTINATESYHYISHLIGNIHQHIQSTSGQHIHVCKCSFQIYHNLILLSHSDHNCTLDTEMICLITIFLPQKFPIKNTFNATNSIILLHCKPFHPAS